MQQYIKIVRSIGNVNVDRELMELMNEMPKDPKEEALNERSRMKTLATKIKGMLDQPKIQRNTLSVSDKEKNFLLKKMDEDNMNSKEVTFFCWTCADCDGE